MSRILRRLLFWGAIVICVLLVVWGLWPRSEHSHESPVDPSVLATSPSAEASPDTRPSTTPSLPPEPTDRCGVGRGPFVPTGTTLVGRTVTVLAVPRDANGTPGTPPLSSAGKRQLAWDSPGSKPGSEQGNALLNAHTWPDGSALGNDLLKRLHEGDIIVVHGDHHRQACYQVTQRLEVPVAKYPEQRVYDTSARPGLVITVCSGLRLGPGDWANRTLWFAVPIK